MYTIDFEAGIMSNEKDALNDILPTKLNKVVKAGESASNALIQRWFGTNALPEGSKHKDFDLRRKKMTQYLTSQCQKIIFVKKTYGRIVDSAEVEQGDFAQVISTCFPNDSDGVPEFVPSGLRVYVLGTGFIDQDENERFNTVAHEISHRVLGTTDYWYGKQDSLDKATANHANVIDCAENWGYFYQELMENS